MAKLTKIQQQVLNINVRPLKILDNDLHRCFYTYKPVINDKHQNCYCTECGNLLGKRKDIVTKNEQILAVHQCPKCKTALKGVITSKDNSESGVLMTCQKAGNFNIYRRFLIYRHCYPGKPANYFLWGEISRQFYSKTRIVSMERKLQMFYYRLRNPFQTDDKLIFRDQLHDNSWSFFKIISSVDHLQIDNKCIKTGNSPYCIFHKLRAGNSMYETLAKNGHYKLISEIRIYDMSRFRNSIRITLKHGYTISDWTMYRDMLEMMRELGLDMNSPKYLCPDNLKMQHDQFEKRIQRQRERIAKEREEARLKEQTRLIRNFEQRMEKYRSIELPMPNNMHIRAIHSMHELQEEGKHMHHCVGMYYKFKNSLILVCRTRTDERVATIEINIQNGSIVQIRAVQNTQSPYEELIKKTLTMNMAYILRPQSHKYNKVTIA